MFVFTAYVVLTVSCLKVILVSHLRDRVCRSLLFPASEGDSLSPSQSGLPTSRSLPDTFRSGSWGPTVSSRWGAGDLSPHTGTNLNRADAVALSWHVGEQLPSADLGAARTQPVSMASGGTSPARAALSGPWFPFRPSFP